MLGMIGLSHHRISCLIGLYPEEHLQEQEIYVDVKVKLDFSKAILDENIEDTLDYVLIADLCTRIAKEKHYHLLEALAKDILDQIFLRFKVTWAWVVIKKPSAVPTAQYAFVELEKTGSH